MHLIKVKAGEIADLKPWGLVFTPTCRPLGSVCKWESKGLCWNSTAGSSEVWGFSLPQCLPVESQETWLAKVQSFTPYMYIQHLSPNFSPS